MRVIWNMLNYKAWSVFFMNFFLFCLKFLDKKIYLLTNFNKLTDCCAFLTSKKGIKFCLKV